MLSVQELEYIRSLISVYSKEGYKYYVCVTQSDTNIDTDIYLYLSKNKIKALNNKTFSSDSMIRIDIDTSYNRYNDKPTILNLVNNVPGNLFVIDTYEYVYTNCEFDYATTEQNYYPDLLLSNSDSYESLGNMYLSTFLLVSIFLYLFIKSILRIRR